MKTAFGEESDTNTEQKNTRVNFDAEIEVFKAIYKRFFYREKYPKLILDDQTMIILNEFINHYHQKSKKGFLLIGDVGVGKTFLMKLYSKYIQFHSKFYGFEVVNVDYLTYLYQSKGPAGIEKYMDYNLKAGVDLCIDELGYEKTTVGNFGTKDNVISTILLSRHRLFEYGKITHATSNLSPDELKKFYDGTTSEKQTGRMASRFREMFTVIIMPEGSKDRRK